MLNEKIKKAVNNYYKIQKNYYKIKKPKKPHIDRYKPFLEQLDKAGEIDYIHYCFGKDECIDVYFDDDCIFHVFKDGTCLLVADEKATGGTFTECYKLLKEKLTNN